MHKADKKLSYVTTLVLLVAIPMMIVLPWLIKIFHIPELVGGAWLGGTLDTTASVTAASELVGPIATLINVLTKLPVLGEILGISLFLMVAGIAWSLININSLPMVVDMTSIERIGTFTGLYYLFSTLSAILGPISNGLMIDLTGGNYNAVMSIAPVTLLIALVLISGVKRGEAVPQ